MAQNRRARHDYDILDTYEAGIVLVGGEVKSFREGKVQLRDSFARVQDGEVWLHGMHVSPYALFEWLRFCGPRPPAQASCCTGGKSRNWRARPSRGP